MLKVLVADENPKANIDCCQYLANDKNLDVIGSNSGTNTLTKYREMHPDVLVINSDFKDKNYKEIINELSTTCQERHKCNIILAIKDDSEKIELNFMAKVYKLFYFPFETNTTIYENIKIGIEQYNIDNIIFYEPTAENLRALFYKLNLYNEQIGADYLKYAIIECYNNSKLLNSLNDILDLVSKKFNVPYNSVRPAMRNALRTVNICRNRNGDKGIFKLFENEDSITPKNFIKIITDYYLKQKIKK